MPASSLDALTSLLAGIRQAYPQARITSGYRGPNNPLTRANPRSYHALGSPEDPRAVDIAPIPGVSFDQYVNSVRQQGVPIAEARDEASHPYPWTTGPNWHLATGAPKQVAAAPVKKPRTLGNLLGASPNPVVGGVDPLAPRPEQSLAMPTPQASDQLSSPMTLADLAGSMPTPKKASPFTAGNVLGVLGDALMAYGGLAPQFGPNLAKQQAAEADRSFDREKLNATVALERYKALHPNNDTANDYAFWQQHLSPAEFEQWKANKINPPQLMNVPGVGIVSVPRSSAVPTAPVGSLTPL